MNPTIIVLEDDARRLNEMRRVIAASSRRPCVRFFDNAHELLQWLPANIGGVCGASLDCDLDTTTVRNSEYAGSGADVADFLGKQPTQFPIVIHSSNAMRAPAMHMTLALAGWRAVKLAPFTDAESWFSETLRLIDDSDGKQ